MDKQAITKEELRTGLNYGIVGLVIGILTLENNLKYTLFSILFSISGFFLIAFLLGIVVESIRNKRKKLK